MNEIIIYQSEDNRTNIEVRFENDTVWLSLNQIAVLFDRDKSVISRHLRNIFREGELEEAATLAKNATVQKEGLREVIRDIEFYNLDAIISVGYRVNSKRGTQFRQWATPHRYVFLTDISATVFLEELLLDQNQRPVADKIQVRAGRRVRCLHRRLPLRR